MRKYIQRGTVLVFGASVLLLAGGAPHIARR